MTTADQPNADRPNADRPTADRPTADRPTAPPDDKDRPTPVDDVVATTHEIGRGRSALRYVATAGRIVLNEEVRADDVFAGVTAKALVNVVSYVLEGKDGDPDPSRPVTFAFNGGPGSSSVWLHLGLLGPRRVVSGDAGAPAAPPYTLVDNDETLLRHSDLVFIDPVSTGYSRPVDGGKVGEFHGFARDLESVAEVIRLWTTRHDRWLSPKFLAGESYGTTRAAALADALQQRHGMYLNGVVLISSVLNFGSVFFTEGNDLPYWTHVPTYAAIAHAHGLRGKASLASVVDEAREFAQGDYQLALAQGHALDPRRRRAVVGTLARITGLSEDYVERANLRIEAHRFFAEVLRHRGQTVGRLDGRFVGYEADGVRETAPESDPSYQAILGPYATALNHYIGSELGYRSDLPYEVLTGKVNPWSYKEFENRSVSVVGELAHAMRANPHLKVHVAFGYHDGATPFLAAEHTLNALPIPAHLRANLEYRYYEAGHMMYVHEPSRRAQSADLAAFVRAAAGR